MNLERFFKTPILYGVDNHIQSKRSKNSRKIQGKAPLLESLFNNAAGVRRAILLTRHFSEGVSPRILKNL